MKSIRHQIFTELQKLSEATLDELLTQCDPINRKQLQDNLNAACTEGLASRRRDDATGLPAYRLTQAGKDRLVGLNAGESFKGKRSANVKPAATRKVEPVAAIDTSSKSVDEMKENRHVVIDELTPEAQRELVILLTEVRIAVSGDSELVPLKEMAQRIVGIKNDCEAHKNALFAACKDLGAVAEHLGIDPDQGGALPIIGKLKEMSALSSKREERNVSLTEQLELEHDEVMRLRAENTSLKQLNKDMPGFGAAHEALKAGQFLILSPKRKPQRVKTKTKAQDIALSAARVHGMAEVYALVPAGKAVRGAVWQEGQ